MTPRTSLLSLLTTLALAVPALVWVGSTQSSAQESAQPSVLSSSAVPTRTLEVAGTGVDMYPEFSPAVDRYAATTTQDTFPSNATDPTANRAATLTVTATTSDPAGRVLVNGVPMTSSQTTLTDVDAGDEISVLFVDSGGREATSVFVLPADFPTLTATVNQPETTAGLVGLTLLQGGATGWPRFSTVVDRNGVPVWVRADVAGGLDLKRQPNGRYSEARPTTTPGRTGFQVVELDSRFRPVATHETVGLVHTDSHDSLLRTNGSRVLLAYEPNPDTGKTDAVIQEVGAGGKVIFEWSSADLVDESLTPTADYAHINSVAVANGGADFLASFRGLSAVLLIARRPHDGHRPGDIVWKLGGRASTLTFVNDPYGGPCAQHTASQLPNGDIMIFDNGSVPGLGGGPICIDRSHPSGPLLARTQSRVAVYRVDAAAHTATLVNSYEPPDRFAWFMGSAQYLPRTGNTLVGWSADHDAVAEEIDAKHEPVWRLVADPSANGSIYMSYRAHKFPVPDATRPTITVTTPEEGARYALHEHVRTAFSCTDVGGSTLQSCGPRVPGRRLDTTTPGRHSITVTARDGAGNTRRVERHYRVGPVTPRPDVMVRGSSGAWVGRHVYGGPARQTAVWDRARPSRTVISFALVNRGNYTDRCRVAGTAGSRPIKVAYRFGHRVVTDAVVAGTWRTPVTRAGHRRVLRAIITVTPKARPGATHLITVRCTSPRDGSHDRAGARLRIRPQ